MSQYDDYSLSGCLFEDNYQGPQLASLGGNDAMATDGAGAAQLPPMVDLRSFCSPVEDQRKTGTCVANAVVGALELLQRKEGHSTQDLSRMFVYYNSRKMHDRQHEDKGTGVQTAMASILAFGVCEERLWPFAEVNIHSAPTEACYANAMHYRGVEFARIQQGTPLTHVLAAGLPVVISVVLPREAYDAAHQTGVMSLPASGGTAHQHSGHSMLAVGYDLGQQAYIIRNSWGEQWGKGGYFMMPFSIFEQVGAARENWAIGSLGKAPGLQLLGDSVADAAAGMQQAAQPAAQPADAGKAIRDELQGGVDKARAGFASRLRGGN